MSKGCYKAHDFKKDHEQPKSCDSASKLLCSLANIRVPRLPQNDTSATRRVPTGLAAALAERLFRDLSHIGRVEMTPFFIQGE